MFHLSPRHIEPFDEKFLSQYKADLIKFLQDTYPEEIAKLDDDGLLEFIDRGMTRAGAYGITIESEITEFVERMVVYEENFDRSRRYPWIAAILNDKGIPGNDKMARIALVELDASLGNEPDEAPA